MKKYKLDNKYGKIVINENCATNIKGVFPGGDAVNGGKEKEVSAAILAYFGMA